MPISAVVGPDSQALLQLVLAHQLCSSCQRSDSSRHTHARKALQVNRMWKHRCLGCEPCLMTLVTHGLKPVQTQEQCLRPHMRFVSSCMWAMQGVIYASPSSKDAPSTIMYRPFDSWAANSDWQVSLPPGEEAVAVTTGQSMSAVATSHHTLRFFSPAGQLPSCLLSLLALAA